MKYKNKKNKKGTLFTYFIYTIILYFYFLAFSEMTYTSSILLSLKRNNSFRKFTSNILLS